MDRAEGSGGKVEAMMKKILHWASIILVIALLSVAAYYLMAFAMMAANVVPD